MNYEVLINQACEGFWNCLTPSDVFQLVAVIIALLAALAAWLSIFLQERQNKKNREPLVVPSIKTVDAIIENIESDWDQREKVPEKFSQTTIPIWNYGSTPIFKISYSYGIENVEDLIEQGELNNNSKIFNQGDYSIIIDKKNEDIYLDLQYQNLQGSEGSKTISIVPFVRYVDVIKPNEKKDFLLPSYLIYLLNDYFINSFPKERKLPIFYLNLTYDDINFKTWYQKFRIYVGRPWNLNGNTLTANIHYEVVSVKKRRKRMTLAETEKFLKKEAKKEKQNKKNKESSTS